MTNPTPARRPHRWWKALAAALMLILGVVAALPWLVGSGPGRSRVAARLNRALAPGRLEFRSLRLSWFGPTRLGDVELFDPKGRPVASAPSATLDRTLGHWILGNPGPLTLTLDGASLDVERSADGSVNLAEALRSVIATPDPRRDLIVKIAGGSLRYRDPALAEPAQADSLDLNLRVRPAPDPVSWTLRLGRGDSALEVRGDYDLWLSRGGPPRSPELQLSVLGRQWPIVCGAAGVDASGRLDGSLDFLRRQGHWRLSGDARLLAFQARGKALQGDTLAFDKLDAGWDIAQGPEGWSIRRLGLTSPLGDLKAEGQLAGVAGVGKQRIEGKVDLAALARQLPHALHLRDGLAVNRGSARLTVDIHWINSLVNYDVEAHVADLAARDRDRPLTLRDPATFTAQLVRDGDTTTLERLAVRTPFLDASARGTLVDGVELKAAINLDRFRDQLGDWLDLGGLELAGQASVTGNYQWRPAGSPMNQAEFDAASKSAGTTPPLSPGIPTPRYEQTVKAAVRDLRVKGSGSWSVHRDRVLVDLRGNGPAETAGWPSGWDWVGALIGSEGSELKIELSSKAEAIGLLVEADTAWKTPRYDEVSAQLEGEWSAANRALRIDRMNLSLMGNRSRNRRPRASGVAKIPEIMEALIAQGRLDLSSGELTLDPIPGDVSAPIVPGPDGIHLTGIGRGLPALRAEGTLLGRSADLDALVAELAGRPPLGLSGQWSAVATARGDADGVQLAGKIGLGEPPNPAGKPARPTSMAARAHYSTGSDRLDLSEFTVSTAYGTLDASGRLDDPAGLRVVDLEGTLSPDFAAINALLAGRIEPGARVEGRPRAFRASGPLGGESPGDRLRGLDAEFGFDLAGADIYGMKFGPSPIVLRARAGKLAFDPISTTLNEGHVRLEPEVDLGAPGGPTIRLAKNSAIRDARINDEVSRRVLAYVAPILDQATRARGLVSVDLDHAEFPIGPGRGRQARVEGAVVFEDVEFAPGPLANELLSAIGRRDASLKLDRPVNLTIADGRVNQRGMAVPIGDLTRIELAGWVDFDRNLALTATLPVTPAMLGNNPLLTEIVAGTLVRLPISGTLDQPVIDREALNANLQEMGKSLLARGATRGAMELLMRLARPRDPGAPPPPPRLTPRERRELRQEKRAIRRGEIPSPPLEEPRP